ncbi:hypothetical protein LIER_03590 [Lithospermum erythrorhizon]|uniref:Extradiol ring-cleavage dioxygenase class III enzyme subunit B domain-containing protein n=1 Tax=Lithospermum erythrorhizon TaxID=34254 RepID=A0AAV3NTQ1_LITER
MSIINQTFYISHGSPTLSIDDSLPARPFLLSFKDKVFSQKPTSILIISAHWETDEPAVNCIQGPHDTIYDFYGFPERMYKITIKQDGVLIIGSGSATHNLRLRGTMGTTAPWALDFDNWLKEALLNGRYEDINDYEHKAPSAKLSHPWPEHFYPLHVAMGAAGMDAKAELIHHSWTGNLSYASYKFEEKTK